MLPGRNYDKWFNESIGNSSHDKCVNCNSWIARRWIARNGDALDAIGASNLVVGSKKCHEQILHSLCSFILFLFEISQSRISSRNARNSRQVQTNYERIFGVGPFESKFSHLDSFPCRFFESTQECIEQDHCILVPKIKWNFWPNMPLGFTFWWWNSSGKNRLVGRIWWHGLCSQARERDCHHDIGCRSQHCWLPAFLGSCFGFHLNVRREGRSHRVLAKDAVLDLAVALCRCDAKP